mmetsp:Transcript_40561/g.112659  ORF Transcript_40561/g.112659 Transcript_40561/m.112659 type:complete len:206 (+) Transcript_40561:965-1582(+)
MKPGSRAAVSRGCFVEKRLLRLRICNIGSMSEIFTNMSFFRKVRKSRNISSRVCSSTTAEAMGQPAAAVARVPALPGPSVPPPSPQLTSMSLLSPCEPVRGSSSEAEDDRARRVPVCAVSELDMGLSCAGAVRPRALPCRSRAPLAHLARRCRTSASDTTGSSSQHRSASTKETCSCSHCPLLPSVTREKWRLLRSASSKLCRKS